MRRRQQRRWPINNASALRAQRPSSTAGRTVRWANLPDPGVPGQRGRARGRGDRLDRGDRRRRDVRVRRERGGGQHHASVSGAAPTSAGDAVRVHRRWAASRRRRRAGQPVDLSGSAVRAHRDARDRARDRLPQPHHGRRTDGRRRRQRGDHAAGRQMFAGPLLLRRVRSSATSGRSRSSSGAGAGAMS